MANDGLKRVGERLDYYSDYRGDENRNNPKFKSEWGKGFIKPYRSSNLENYVVMGLSAAGIAAGGAMTGVGLNITSGISSKLKETMDSNASTVNSAAAKVLEQMGINQDDAKKLAQWQADLNTVMYGRIEEGSPITLELYIIKDGKIVGTETKTFETSLLQDQEELDNLAKQWDAAGFEERAEIDKQIDEVTKRIADKDGLLDRAKLPDVSTETKGQIENVVAEELDVPKTMAKGKALTGVGATLMGVSALIEIYQIISFIVKLNNGYRLLQGANTNNDGISIIKDKKKAIVKTSSKDDDRVLLKASDNPDEYRYSKAGYYQYGKTVPGEKYEGGKVIEGHSWVVAGNNEPADDVAALSAKDIQDVEENKNIIDSVEPARKIDIRRTNTYSRKDRISIDILTKEVEKDKVYKGDKLLVQKAVKLDVIDRSDDISNKQAQNKVEPSNKNDENVAKNNKELLPENVDELEIGAPYTAELEIQKIFGTKIGRNIKKEDNKQDDIELYAELKELKQLKQFSTDYKKLKETMMGDEKELKLRQHIKIDNEVLERTGVYRETAPKSGFYIKEQLKNGNKGKSGAKETADKNVRKSKK